MMPAEGVQPRGAALATLPQLLEFDTGMRALVAWLAAYGCAGWMLSTRLPMRRVALAAGGEEAVEALRSRAVACMGRGDFEAAFSAFESLAALAPRDARARSGLGAACSALGDVSAACAHMRQAVALDPSSGLASYNLGLALLRLAINVASVSGLVV